MGQALEWADELLNVVPLISQAFAWLRSHPGAAFAGLALGLAGMSWRAWQLLARPGRAAGVDFARLQSLSIQSYVPWLKDNLRGHDATLDALAQVLDQNLALAKTGRTLGGFLLVGPTGTGKTFLAQLLSQALYPQSEPLILRMNQYKHQDDVFTLLGPPPGVKGFEVGGTLTRPVLENPYRVVLLDELEKAHRDVHHCLYDILDTGQCREKSSGKTVSFAACVFVGTSNAGVDELRRLKAGTPDPAAWQGRAMDALTQDGRLEKAFLARFNGGILLLDELDAVHVAEVACLKLARRLREYGMELVFTSPAVLLEAVSRNEEFKGYGVRQLESYLQHKTDAAIAAARRDGHKKVSLDIGPGGQVLITPVAEAQA